jgi:hypothetical protein
VGPAQIVPLPPTVNRGNLVRASAAITVTRFSTRFLKIEARNDGSNGSPGYIELRNVKAFAE